MAGLDAVAKAVVRADNRKLRGDLAKSRSMFGRTFSKIGKGVKGSLKMALSPLGVGAGALGIAAIGQEVLSFEESLTRIAIQANMSGKATDKMRQEMLALGKETGLSRQEVAATATSLINLTGDIDFTLSSMRVLADANAATGASMEDLAGLAFSLKESFGLVEPEELAQGLSAIITAGKEGAIPLGEMSVILQQLSASFKDVGGLGKGGAADLAAALQVLRPAFGTAAEAGTGLQSMMTALKKKSVDLAKNGIQVFEKDAATGEKTFRGLRSILDDLAASPLAKDPALLVKTLGRVEAEKAVKAWTEGRDRFEELAESARRSSAVQEDADRYRSSSAGKLKKSLNDAKETVADTFTPNRIKMFANAMEDLAKVLGFMVDNAAAFAAVWAGIKINSLVSGFSSIASTTGALKGGAGGCCCGPGGMGAGAGVGGKGKKGGRLAKLGRGLNTAANATGAFAVGYGVGSVLDDYTGASDKISDAMTESQASGMERGRSKVITENAARLQMLSQMEGLTGLNAKGKKSMVDSAHQLLFTARGQGLIDEGGGVNREKVGRALLKANGVDFHASSSERKGQFDAVVAALEKATKVMAEQKTLKVEATVNGEPADVRRSPQ